MGGILLFFILLKLGFSVWGILLLWLGVPCLVCGLLWLVEDDSHPATEEDRIRLMKKWAKICR